MEIKKVGIAGAGLMGASMAQIFARYGYEVVLFDAFEASLEKGKALVEINQKSQVELGEETEAEAEAIIKALSYSNDMNSLRDCDIIIECIVEKLDIKVDFWSKLSRIVRSDAILATNTSGLPINSVSKDVVGKHRFLGMHWMNPSHLIPLVEIIKGKETDEETTQTVIDLAHKIGKKTAICKKDVPGFILNRIQYAALRECLYIVEQGIADMEDVDACVKYGVGFRYAAYGPFEIVDFGGLDTFYNVTTYLNKDLCDTKEEQGLLARLNKEGNLGVKTGKGFYDYSGDKAEKALKERDEKYVKIYNALYK